MCFDEKKTWEWTSSHSEDDQPSTLKISFGEYGNRGVREDEDKEKTEQSSDESVKVDDIEPILPDSLEESATEITEMRRLMRVSKKPSYLGDYVYLVEVEGERFLLLINMEPWGFSSAIEEKVWRDACEEEMSSIIKNKTWDLVDLPHGAKAIGLKWIFKIKRNSYGSINKHKSRLMAKGYIERHEIDFERFLLQWLVYKLFDSSLLWLHLTDGKYITWMLEPPS